MPAAPAAPAAAKILTFTRILPWALRLGWLALPFATGPAVTAWLRHHSADMRLAAEVELWLAWAVGLVAVLVPHPLSLTTVRLLTPAGVAVAIAAAASDRPSPGGAAVAVAVSLLVAGLVYLPETGTVFVNGAAYPNERRYLLRVPGPLVIGPLELAWALVVTGPTVGGLLIGAHHWVLGPLILVISLPPAIVAARSVHGLSRRWVVFVPAGLVLHDPIGLADPVLFPRQTIQSLHPAPVGTEALDLTQRAFGLALELALKEPAALAISRPGNRTGEPKSTDHLLFTPTRPGAVLATAAGRRIPVGRA
jgi:hypothetical protein